MAKREDVIYALRCTCTPGKPYECRKDCPYKIVVTGEEREEMCRDFGLDSEKLDESFFEGCNYDQIGLDAADMLEAYGNEEDDGR